MSESQAHGKHGGSRSGQHSHGSHKGNRRSGRAVQTCAGKASEGVSGRVASARGGRGRGGAGKTASALCVMGAFLGFCVELVTELIAHSREEPANLFFNSLAALLVVAAFVAGGYAQMVQARQWSRRVRRRLVIGMAVNVFTLLMVAANFMEKGVAGGEQARAVAEEIRAVSAPPQPEDTALAQPGWYGEVRADGVVVSVLSFPERSFQSRSFNRRVIRPVSYGTLTVVNLGAAGPVALDTSQVGLVLDSGEEVGSLAVGPLLRQVSQNHALLLRLSEPQELAIGGMLTELPVCQEPGFAWGRVREVKVTVSGRVVTVPGRMMTADERQDALAKTVVLPPPPVAKNAAAVTNLSAEAWFKDL